ncbi:hypothetical protein B0H19DRAFT_1168227, partial [Mycena capillaripes]
TASMFASNFIIADAHLTHARGCENLTTYVQSRTIATGNTMTYYFCSTCGTLMYRASSGFPGMSLLPMGTVDNFNLHETKLKPIVELCLHGAEGVRTIARFERGSKVRCVYDLYTVVFAPLVPSFHRT